MAKIQKEKYGVITTSSLVIGIVIGSGIFFKVDDILNATGGSVLLGVLGFIFVGTGVLFGALVVSNYAQQGSKEGGMIAYSKTAWGHRFGFIAGWFMTMVYFPALIVVLGYITADYFIQLTHFNLFGDKTIWFLTVFFITLSYTVNILSTKLAGTIQGIATFIKLLPLIFIGVAGILSNPQAVVSSVGDVSTITSGASTIQGFLIALIAIAFTCDGWIVSTSVSAEIKDSKKNLPRALTFGVLGIVIIYIIYFLGMTTLIDPNVIMESGNAHASMAANKVIPGIGGQLMLICICVSVYGGLNGRTLAYFRLPHALVSNGLLKDKMNIKKVSSKYGISLGSVLFGIPCVIIFFILHYIANCGIGQFSLLKDMGFDISSLPVTVNYFFYISLYIGAAKFIKNGTAPKIVYLYITIAVMIAVLVIYGSILNNGLVYIAIALVFIAVGLKWFMMEEK